MREASAVLAVEFLLARLAIPAGPARRTVIAATIAAAISTAVAIAATPERLAAALTVAPEGPPTTFAITAKGFSTRTATLAWPFLAVLPFVEEHRVEAIASDHTLIAPDGLDRAIFGDSLDRHAHRAGFEDHQVADFEFVHFLFSLGALLRRSCRGDCPADGQYSGATPLEAGPKCF